MLFNCPAAHLEVQCLHTRADRACKGTADRKENAAETEWEDCRIGERRWKWCEWQQQSMETTSSNRECDPGLWEKERGSQKSCPWDGEKAATKRDPGTTGTCQARVLWRRKRSHLIHEFLIKTYISRNLEYKMIHAGAPKCYKPSHCLLKTTSLMCVCVLSHFGHVWHTMTLWTLTCQAPLSKGFSR